MDDIQLREGTAIDAGALVDLYTSVGWTLYAADADALVRAIGNSSYVVSAWAGDQLVGLARMLSDDVSVAYLQDILVRPELHGRGVGSRLAERCLARYQHVRQKVLLTDDRPDQIAFYTKLGYANLRETSRPKLNAFVRIEGVTFE